MLFGSLINFGTSGPVISSVTQTDSSIDASGTTVYTFTSQSLGGPTANTHMLLLVAYNKASVRTLTSVTIDGDPMSTLCQLGSSGTFNVGTGIFYKKIGVDYGSTAKIVVTANNGLNGCGIGIITFERTGTITTVDTLTARTNSDTTATGTIDVSANGLLAGIGVIGTTGAFTPTFSAGITDDTADTVTGDCEYVVGFDTFAAAESGRTVTITGGSTQDHSMSVVSLL